MKSDKLQDAIGNIDDEYINEAYKAKKKKGWATKAAGAVISAACFAFILVSGALKTTAPDPMPEDTKGTTEMVAETGAKDDGTMTTDGPTEPVDVADGYGEYYEGAEGEAGADGDHYTVHGETHGTESATGAGDEPVIDFPGYDDGEPFVLTGARWNDNANWPFFTNLVNTGTIGFPSFGIDPRTRIKVNITDDSGAPLGGETAVLLAEDGSEIWRAQSGRDGAAYLFAPEGTVPASVSVNGEEQALEVVEGTDDPQGTPVMVPVDEITFVTAASAPAKSGLQVMFILDTTGSMGDELAYLQKDFVSIAEDAGTDGITYSVNFYRDEGDEYVTKCNGFTGDIEYVKSLISAEYSRGGGDTPEAVDRILKETITDNGEWDEASEKLVFIIFDAPPHYGTESTIDEAIKSAAERGIHIVPVVASNAERETELFGRAMAICTNGEYVFLTDDSGIGDSHLEPIVGDYTVQLLHDIIVDIITEYR